MSDLTISYKGQNIVDVSETVTKTLNTKDKVCDDNLVVSYTKPPSGFFGSIKVINTLSTDTVVASKDGKTITGVWTDDSYHLISNIVDLGTWMVTVNSKEYDVLVDSIEQITLDIAEDVPREYQAVEYLRATGSQYIETDFIPNGNSKAVIKGLFASAGECYLASSEETYYSRAFGFYRSTSSSTVYMTFGNSNHAFSKNYTNVVFVATNDKGSSSYVWANGQTETYNFGSKTFTAPYTFCLFALHRSSISTNGTKNIYYCELYDNDVLIHNYRPCYRKSDNVAGMYDTVTGEFLTNKGSGTFVVGGDI